MTRVNVDGTIQTPADRSDDYSSLRVVSGLCGIELLQLDNVCFDIHKQTTYIYSSNEKYISSKHISEKFPPKSWNFKVEKRTIPSTGHWIDDAGCYLMISHSNRNIAHFTEVFNFVYHYLHNRLFYPSLHSLYFLQYYREAVYPWILSYIDVALSLFPKNRAFRSYFLEELSQLDKDGLICFKHAVLFLETNDQ